MSERKGLSVVGAVLPMSAVTEKDRRDLAFALEMGADWIAMSFVQRPQDLDELRELAGRPVWVITNSRSRPRSNNSKRSWPARMP